MYAPNVTMAGYTVYISGVYAIYQICSCPQYFRENMGLEFDGVKDYVILHDVNELEVNVR